MTTHIVMFSGGIGSWATAKLVAETYGTDDLILLFADTLMEDEDLYRFLDEAAANVGGQLIRICEGRDPWQVFADKQFLGNSLVDPCSYYLKRTFMRKWLETNHDPASTVCYLGIDWTEADRFTKSADYWAPWTVRAPLIDELRLDRDHQLVWLKDEGIAAPRLYAMGFPHNNCGGFCIKAGQKSFQTLLEQLPERYAYHEQKEQELRAQLGKNVAIMQSHIGGRLTPLTLQAFRKNIEGGQIVDPYDFGGCNCLNPDAAVDLQIESLAPVDRLLTSSEVAQRFQVTARTVSRWGDAGRIPVLLTPDGHRRFRESDVQVLLDKYWAGV